MSDSNGKGDKQRPRTVSQDEYQARWEETFGKDKPAPKPKNQHHMGGQLKK